MTEIEIDTEARTGHPAIMTSPPRRRFGCVALILNPDGHVLMVRPEYQPTKLVLPGGSAEPDEAPNVAAARWVLTETGLVLDLWQLVAVDYVSAGEIPEGVNFVFWGGQLPGGKAANAAAPPVERSGILETTWVPPADLPTVTDAEQTARVIDALRVVSYGAGIPLLLRGRPAGA
ncbi:NUDIX domain-containing protein [Kitasatospora sp. NPDC094011]|uniref:NUDIX domain-containing protein n=1 Tax=Kitasatospora sp. NPDC094011 TaxID=3364090 RepID=UPI0038232FEA